jgi:hypothetical protein
VNQPENPFAGIGMYYDWRSYGAKSPDENGDVPLWSPRSGFAVAIEWCCGCCLTGTAFKPLILKKKKCPSHPDAVSMRVRIQGLSVWNYPIESWPPGTFSAKSRRGIVRMSRILIEAETYAHTWHARHASKEEKADLDRNIAETQALIDAALERRPRPTLVKIPRSA